MPGEYPRPVLCPTPWRLTRLTNKMGARIPVLLFTAPGVLALLLLPLAEFAPNVLLRRISFPRCSWIATRSWPSATRCFQCLRPCRICSPRGRGARTLQGTVLLQCSAALAFRFATPPGFRKVDDAWTLDCFKQSSLNEGDGKRLPYK